MSLRSMLLLAFLFSSGIVFGQTREWSDPSGRFTMEAELIAASDTTAVLQGTEKELLAVAIDQLSEADREYIGQWREKQDSTDPLGPDLWTMANGLQVKGWVVAYGRRDVTLQRHRGKLYVNDRRFDNLPEIYQKMVPRIVGHFEGEKIETAEELWEWARRLKAEPRTFTVDGVMLELEAGDRYMVPFFFFSPTDRRILEPGWQRWLAQEKEAAAQEHENFLLRAQTEAYERDRETAHQMRQLQLQMLAIDAGLIDLWKVHLVPQQGARLMPLTVIVPARNSRDAAQAAVAAHPGYVAGPIARVR